MDSRASMLDLGGAIMMYPFFSEWRTKHGSNTNGHAPKLGICKLTYEYIYIQICTYIHIIDIIATGFPAENIRNTWWMVTQRIRLASASMQSEKGLASSPHDKNLRWQASLLSSLAIFLLDDILYFHGLHSHFSGSFFNFPGFSHWFNHQFAVAKIKFHNRWCP